MKKKRASVCLNQPAFLAQNGNNAKHYREQVNLLRNDLITLFWQNPSASLMQEWLQCVDDIVCYFWQRAELTTSFSPCLIAVGGYGRKEFFPYSDIDLLILTEDSLTTATQEKISYFIQLLWDSGFQVGHSVRSLNTALATCQHDQQATTHLLEARVLAGESTLFTTLIQRVNQTCWPIADYFSAKITEQHTRHEKFHHSAQPLEPNIKNSPGGLRDIHTLLWLCLRHFGTLQLTALKRLGFLLSDECRELTQAQQWLQTLRFALHCLTGKKEDRLLFDHQQQLSQRFGFDKVEMLMQRYYRTAQTINQLNLLLIQLFRETVLETKHAYIGINKHWRQTKNHLDIVNADYVSQHPHALLDAFVLLAENPRLQGMTARTLRALKQNRKLINTEFRNDPHNRSAFLRLMHRNHAVAAHLTCLHQLGLLGRYLPAFEHIRGQMQFDLFHAYTVDQHILFVIRNIENLVNDEKNFALCAKLLRAMPKREVIYLAALFHDIAKGRGGDHSLLGEQEARTFCQSHQLERTDSEDVCWLVQDHLLMSSTAQRRDITDPDVISTFAQRVQTTQRLAYLYVLTVADIRATNETLWNGWKHSLLQELYHATFATLAQRPRTQLEIIRQRKQKSLLQLSALTPDSLTALWQQFGKDYFLHHSVAEIVWHTQALLTSAESMPLILIGNHIHSDSTDIFVYAPDQDNLFATIVSVLSKAGLNILDARIMTSKKGYSLDSFRIQARNSLAMTDTENIAHLKIRLQKQLLLCKPVHVPLQKHRHTRSFQVQTRIVITHDQNKKRSILEVDTLDRAGLLATIGSLFVEFSLRIHTAKIVTLGERVEDVFYLSERKSGGALSTSTQRKLIAALRAQCLI